MSTSKMRQVDCGDCGTILDRAATVGFKTARAISFDEDGVLVVAGALEVGEQHGHLLPLALQRRL